MFLALMLTKLSVTFGLGGGLRKASAIIGSIALITAFLLIVIRILKLVAPNLAPWTLKSAFPLILVGIAFAFLQLAIPRSRTQLTLGFVVSAAFILWGTEQFLSNPALVATIDDLVVFLFVLDLSLAIFGQQTPNRRRTENELPFDVKGP